MTQLIDKEGVFEAVKWCADELDIEVVQRFIEILSNQPIVYEVPVIRCKDCMYNYGNKYEYDYNHEDIVCKYWMSDGLTDKDFCSMAKRREE